MPEVAKSPRKRTFSDRFRGHSSWSGMEIDVFSGRPRLGKTAKTTSSAIVSGESGEFASREERSGRVCFGRRNIERDFRTLQDDTGKNVVNRTNERPRQRRCKRTVWREIKELQPTHDGGQKRIVRVVSRIVKTRPLCRVV